MERNVIEDCNISKVLEDCDSDVSGLSVVDDIDISPDDGNDDDIEEERGLFIDNEMEVDEVSRSNENTNKVDEFVHRYEDMFSDVIIQDNVDQGDLGVAGPSNIIREVVDDRPNEVLFVGPSGDNNDEIVNISPTNITKPSSRPRGRPRGRPTLICPVRGRGRSKGLVNRPRQQTNRPNYNIGWQHCTVNDTAPVKYTYNNYAHFRPLLGKEIKTELDYFQLFFTDSLIQEITTETNRYATEKIQKSTPLQNRSIWHSWRDVTLSEMKAFLGVILNMAMHEKAELRDYFSEDWLDKQPFFKDIFSRDRFFQIFWTLHLCAPVASLDDRPSRPTRADKIKRIACYLDSKFREHYCPGQNISVDESTVGFKGKVIFKCYNKLKPIKWGLRIYVLSDSSNGYICAMEPYFGSYTTNNLIRPDLPFTVRIVLHLVAKLLEENDSTGFHIFTDRFYTSYILGQELLKLNIHLTGTIMPGRLGLPDAVKKNSVKNLEHHECVSLRKEESLVLVWRDKRDVTMYSTAYDNSTEPITRIVKSGVTETINKPKVICEYNKYMGGVDISDHYISSYGFTRKSLKWWRKLFFWLLETSVVNAYILYSLETEKPIRHRVFRKNLVRQLVGDVRNVHNRKRGRPSLLDNSTEVRLNGKFHAMYKLEGRRTRDCKVCSDRNGPGGRKESSTYCKTCPNEPALHIGECFEKYHTMKEFR